MKNLPLCILIAVILVIVFVVTVRENFSSSGLSLSDDECVKLADAYYRPLESEGRDDYRERICGKKRRETIDMKTGNYFTVDGVLI